MEWDEGLTFLIFSAREVVQESWVNIWTLSEVNKGEKPKGNTQFKKLDYVIKFRNTITKANQKSKRTSWNSTRKDEEILWQRNDGETI